MQTDSKEAPRPAIVAAVQLPQVDDIEFESSLAELRDLAKTLGFAIVATFTQKRTSFDATAYLGTGKREEIREFVDMEPAPGAFEKPLHGAADPAAGRIDALFVDHEMSPMRRHAISRRRWACEVMDRTMVILEIFHRHARSRAARAQVEIVRLAYLAPRLREAAKLAGPQGRQRSGAGGRGAGESRGELDRRKIRDRIAELQKELVVIDAERQDPTLAPAGTPAISDSVALVGYTNAGKSTLDAGPDRQRGAGGRQAVCDAGHHGARAVPRNPCRACW
jgi:GTP-binding protein HflX